MNELLADATDMGMVTLRVADLDIMSEFYREGVGLEQLDAGIDSMVLGHGARPIVRLQFTPGLRHASSRSAGLFHSALLFDSPAALASAVHRVATQFPSHFSGASDHGVSNAFYFADPEHNGVELYWDRPRASWIWGESTIQMGTGPLDPNAFLREHLLDTSPDADTSIGHVHLKVGDIPTAKAFYVDIIGFQITMRVGDQALFVSAGGYHHHIGMNTWQSLGAGPRTPALGLGQVTIRVPDRTELKALKERLVASQIAVRDDGRTLEFEDPWRNLVRVATK